MNKKFTLLGSLALALAMLGGAVSAQIANNPYEVDAETGLTYGLIGDRTESNWSEYFAYCEDTGSGGNFTIDLTLGEKFKIVINADGWTNKWWLSYSETLSRQYSAYFSDDGTGNCVVNVAGTYGFAFDANWNTYNDKSYGLTLSCPTVSTRTVTYSTVLGDNGDYLNGEKSVSVAIGTEALTYADFAPTAVYGTTFSGFYSDEACTSSIPLTAEVTADVSGIYAKFAYSEGAVDYEFDYSAATSTVFNSSYSLYVNYWNGSGSSLTWPGLGLGRVDNGIVTATIPSDATGVQLVSVDDTDTVVGKTANVTVAPASDEINHIFLVSGGELNSENVYVATANLADAGYMAIYDALETVKAQCGTSASGTTATEAITTAWANIATGAASTSYLAHLTGVTSNEDLNGMAGLISIYDHCTIKYALDDPLNRVADSLALYKSNTLGDTSSQVGIVIAASIGGALILLGGYFIIRRKRKSHKA